MFLQTQRTKRALEIARSAHEGQTDKAGKPYIDHPLHLACRMSTEDEVCAALLHDVIEDSTWTIEDLRNEDFSRETIEAVSVLTHDEDTPYFDYISVVKRNPLARKIKIEDLKHNSDISRIPNPTNKDWKRIQKYEKALRDLQENAG